MRTRQITCNCNATSPNRCAVAQQMSHRQTAPMRHSITVTKPIAMHRYVPPRNFNLLRVVANNELRGHVIYYELRGHQTNARHAVTKSMRGHAPNGCAGRHQNDARLPNRCMRGCRQIKGGDSKGVNEDWRDSEVYRREISQHVVEVIVGLSICRLALTLIVLTLLRHSARSKELEMKSFGICEEVGDSKTGSGK